MLYTILKPLTFIFYRIYYKIEIKGREKTPYGSPLIIAPNHTNGFIDPVIVATALPNKVRGFARGDAFKGRIAKWALDSMNVSPIFRMQEGFSEVKKNDKTFEECRTLLSNNKTLLLFPEAICVQEKRLRPLKKGLSRIIFQTEDLFDFKKNISIVPVGLNYTDAKKFRSKLFINFGKPISVSGYAELYKQDKVKTINDFTKVLEKEMAKLIITIKNKDNDELVENINEIYLSQWMKEKQFNPKNIEKQYYVSKEIAEMINYHDTTNPAVIELLKNKIIPYCKHLKNHNLRDHLLRPEIINKMKFGNFLLDFFIILFGMPIYFIGLVMNYPPYYISRNFTNKKVKKAEFYASFFANLAMLLWIFYYGIQLLTIAFVFCSWIFLGIYAVLVPVTGLYVLRFYSVIKKIFGRLRLMRMVRMERNIVEELLRERLEIITEIDLAKKEYLGSLQ